MSVTKQQNNKNIRTAPLLLLAAVIFLAFISLFLGSSNMTISDGIAALLRKGTAANNRIIWSIRLPRIMAAIVAGAGLSLSGLIMQTNLNNPMASPSTLGVSNAAVFGANLSIIAFAGGFLSTGNNLSGYTVGANPYATSLVAFIFSTVSIVLILGLCRIRAFQPGVVVLAGIAIGSVWTAATTILQFFATDVGISAAVIWNFGDLGRATYTTDLIMAVVVLFGAVYFTLSSWKLNALLSGDAAAHSMGVNVNRLRALSMLLASLITAVCVSFLGIIGFKGIIGPHIIKRLIGHDHRFSIPGSMLTGSLVLLLADTFSRTAGKGSALPVGAITSLLGAPFFVAIIFSKRGTGHYD
jgi:iron complex transport system permease protein